MITWQPTFLKQLLVQTKFGMHPNGEQFCFTFTDLVQRVIKRQLTVGAGHASDNWSRAWPAYANFREKIFLRITFSVFRHPSD
jgi:hypothetical protein